MARFDWRKTSSCLALGASLLAPVPAVAADAANGIGLDLSMLRWGISMADARSAMPSLQAMDVFNPASPTTAVLSTRSYVLAGCPLNLRLGFDRNVLVGVDMFADNRSEACGHAVWERMEKEFGAPTADADFIDRHANWFGPDGRLKDGERVFWADLTEDGIKKTRIGLRAADVHHLTPCAGGTGDICAPALGLDKLRWGMSEHDVLAAYPELKLHHPDARDQFAAYILTTDSYPLAGCSFDLHMFFSTYGLNNVEIDTARDAPRCRDEIVARLLTRYGPPPVENPAPGSEQLPVAPGDTVLHWEGAATYAGYSDLADGTARQLDVVFNDLTTIHFSQ